MYTHEETLFFVFFASWFLLARNWREEKMFIVVVYSNVVAELSHEMYLAVYPPF